MKVYSGEGWFNLDWNPKAYKTKASAAKGLYKAICNLCHQLGYDPKGEVWIKNPQESLAHGYVGKAWHVSWECGPYEWACGICADGKWGHCETFWGFDLAFYE